MSTNTVSQKGKRSKKRASRSRTSGNQAQVAKFAGDAYSVGERAYRGVQHILKLINIETKFFDYSLGSTTITTTAAVQTISLIQQGVDVSNRLGDSIKLQGLTTMLSITPQPLTPFNYVRLMMVRDSEARATVPLFSDIINTSLGPLQVMQYNYFTYQKRFSILYDEVFVMNPATLYYSGFSKTVHTSHNGHIKWEGNGVTSSSFGEGQIYLIYLTTAAANGPVLDWITRFAYTDD
jgi:hypothetical protein